MNAVIVSKEHYSEDLRDFAELLNEYGGGYFDSLVSCLYTASSNLKFKDGFEVELNQAVCEIDKKPSGTIPLEVQKIFLYLEHKIVLNGLDYTVNDPIDYYELQFDVVGFSENGEYCTAWHLDKDIEVTNPDAVQKYTHPKYHFQFGGRKMKEIETGNALFLSSPRLPHPPMDIFLAVHFVIKNFFNAREYVYLYTIFENSKYQEIIERAQDRFFIPYFSSLKKESEHNHFSLSNLFPLAVFD